MSKIVFDEIFDRFVKPHHHVSCDEFHAHLRKCIVYDTEEADVIDYLRIEVLNLRKRLAKISELAVEAE